MSELDKSGWKRISFDIQIYPDVENDIRYELLNGNTLFYNPSWPGKFIFVDREHTPKGIYEIPFATFCFLKLRG